VRQFGRLLSPALTDVRVEWGGLDVTQAPTEVPPVFADGRVLVYGLVTGGEARLGPGTTNVKVRLTAVAPPGPVSFDVPVDLAHARAGRTVAPLAARARIRELEESPEWTLMRGSRQRDRKSTAIAQEIVGLSVRYGVISRETSFVAVERRDVPLTGDLKLRRVPIALTSGWGGLQATPMLMPARASLADTQAVVASFGAHASIEDVPPSAGGWFSRPFSGRSRASQRTTSSLEHRAESPAMPRHGRRSGTRSTPSPVPAGMHELVALQRADGSWELTPALAAVLGHELADLEAALAGATGSRDDARRAWATALALVWLREHARDAGDEWRLLGAKARRWLDDVQAAPAGRLPWLEAAAHLVVGGP
jgi:Ca-activated chloride channel family protein